MANEEGSLILYFQKKKREGGSGRSSSTSMLCLCYSFWWQSTQCSVYVKPVLSWHGKPDTETWHGSLTRMTATIFFELHKLSNKSIACCVYIVHNRKSPSGNKKRRTKEVQAVPGRLLYGNSKRKTRTKSNNGLTK